MSKTTIPTGGITADAIDATKIADDAISEEHLDATAITGHTALAEAPASTDEFLISDGGVLKRLDASLIGGDNTPSFFGELASDSSDQSAGARVKVTGMTANEIDTDSAFDGTTFTVPSGEAGKYFIFGMVSMSSVGGSYTGEATDGQIYVNGSSVIKARFRNHTTRDIGEDTQQVSGIINLSAGDTVELYGRFANDDYKFVAQDTAHGGTNFGGFKLIGV